MTTLRETFVRQFGNPSGPLGALASFIMQVRPSNRERNARTLALLEIQRSSPSAERSPASTTRR
jgi:hypothetical protein